MRTQLARRQTASDQERPEKERDARKMIVARWASRYGSLFVAGISLGIACLSLIYTIQAQRNDATYKEVAIKPSLTWNTSLEDFGLNLESVGLGPAVIDSVAMRHKGKCVIKTHSDLAIAADKEFEVRMHDVLVDLLNSEARAAKKEFKVPYATQAAIPTVGQMLPAGTKINVFGIVEQRSEAVHDWVVKNLDSDALNRVYHRMWSEYVAFGLVVTYCSVTKLYCVRSHFGEKGCSQK